MFLPPMLEHRYKKDNFCHTKRKFQFIYLFKSVMNFIYFVLNCGLEAIQKVTLPDVQHNTNTIQNKRKIFQGFYSKNNTKTHKQNHLATKKECMWLEKSILYIYAKHIRYNILYLIFVSTEILTKNTEKWLHCLCLCGISS